MVKASGAECETPPAVPTTITVVPGGALWLLELLHPTAPNSNPSNSTAEPSAHSLVRRNMLFWLRSTPKTRPSKPIPTIEAGITYPVGGT